MFMVSGDHQDIKLLFHHLLTSGGAIVSPKWAMEGALWLNHFNNDFLFSRFFLFGGFRLADFFRHAPKV